MNHQILAAAASGIPVMSDGLCAHRERLRKHIGLYPLERPAIEPVFFIEKVYSRDGVHCKLPTCEKIICFDEYCLVLIPGMYVNVNLRGKNSIEPYHIPCFEKLADFSHIEFLQRITLLTRRNWKTREVSVENFLKGAHVLDGGAERLVQHWVTVRVLLLGLRDQGEYIDAAQVPDPGSLYYSAGAPGYEHIAQPEKDMPEFLNFLVTLAPNESDGPDDREVWNLFDTYLTQQDVESFGNPHNLSEMLAKWDHDKRIANIPDEGATEEVKQEKARLGPKAIRALVRLSTVLVPHVQKTIMDQP